MKNAASRRPNIFVRKPSLRLKGMTVSKEAYSLAADAVTVLDPIANVPSREASPSVGGRSSSSPSSSIGGRYPLETVLDVLGILPLSRGASNMVWDTVATVAIATSSFDLFSFE